MQDIAFTEFKHSINPFLTNVKHIAIKQLKLFKSINDSITITDETVSDYELFHRVCRAHPNTIVPASLEVQLLWNVHALNPRCYFNDNHNTFGDVISVNIAKTPLHIVSQSEMAQNIRSVMSNEWITTQRNTDSFVQTLDLKAAVVRQMKFIRKMNAIQNSEDITSAKIDAATERYCKFLYLMKLEGHTGARRMSVPALDVDLIWHSHLLDAEQYHKMCRFMIPNINVIDHDDSICFKKIMKQYREETRRRWGEAFGNDDYFKGRVFGKNIVFTKTGHVFRPEKVTKRVPVLSSLDQTEISCNTLETVNRETLSLSDTIQELVKYKQQMEISETELKQKLNKQIQSERDLHRELQEHKNRIKQLKRERDELHRKLENRNTCSK
eukprot:738449_1